MGSCVDTEIMIAARTYIVTLLKLSYNLLNCYYISKVIEYFTLLYFYGKL